jgi:hypothetical protein
VTEIAEIAVPYGIPHAFGRCGDLDVAHLDESRHRDEEIERAHDWSARMSIAPAP